MLLTKIIVAVVAHETKKLYKKSMRILEILTVISLMSQADPLYKKNEKVILSEYLATQMCIARWYTLTSGGNWHGLRV